MRICMTSTVCVRCFDHNDIFIFKVVVYEPETRSSTCGIISPREEVLLPTHIISVSFCDSNHLLLLHVVRMHLWLKKWFFVLCQAAVTIQDSCHEVQRLLLQESGRPSPRAQRPHLPSIRGSTLQEQEKQRNLEKRKEEVAAAHRLQERLRQEKERWERECQARESQQGEQESRLEERERQCHLEAERLRRAREELDEQLEEYQQGLERLREGQRNVEKERERLENQQQLLETFRHGRQRSLPTVIPHMVIPLDGQQVGEAHNFLLQFNPRRLRLSNPPPD